jgi:hypothetical protein
LKKKALGSPRTTGSTGFTGLWQPVRSSTVNKDEKERSRYVMPGKKHLRGVGVKEQREYEHIKENAERSGRYGDRAKEVAARTVMKQHKAKGHRTGQ